MASNGEATHSHRSRGLQAISQAARLASSAQDDVLKSPMMSSSGPRYHDIASQLQDSTLHPTLPGYPESDSLHPTWPGYPTGLGLSQSVQQSPAAAQPEPEPEPEQPPPPAQLPIAAPMPEPEPPQQPEPRRNLLRGSRIVRLPSGRFQQIGGGDAFPQPQPSPRSTLPPTPQPEPQRQVAPQQEDLVEETRREQQRLELERHEQRIQELERQQQLPPALQPTSLPSPRSRGTDQRSAAWRDASRARLNAARAAVLSPKPSLTPAPQPAQQPSQLLSSLDALEERIVAIGGGPAEETKEAPQSSRSWSPALMARSPFSGTLGYQTEVEMALNDDLDEHLERISSPDSGRQSPELVSESTWATSPKSPIIPPLDEHDEYLLDKQSGARTSPRQRKAKPEKAAAASKPAKRRTTKAKAAGRMLPEIDVSSDDEDASDEEASTPEAEQESAIFKDEKPRSNRSPFYQPNARAGSSDDDDDGGGGGGGGSSDDETGVSWTRSPANGGSRGGARDEPDDADDSGKRRAASSGGSAISRMVAGKVGGRGRAINVAPVSAAVSRRQSPGAAAARRAAQARQKHQARKRKLG